MSDSHSDVERELLALAGGGGDSSDDEGSRPSTRQRSRTRSRSRSRSRSQARSRSQSHRPADDSPPRSIASKKVQAKRRSGGGAESEDEGEASEPGSPGSQGSAAMDESDSDDGSDASPDKAVGDEENKYPVEGLFTSNAERREIMNMREVEREQILAEREAEKERLRQKALLRRLVTNNEGKQNKRKGGDDEEDFEESTRKKARSGPKSGLDMLKRARAEKKERMSRRGEDDHRRDRSPSFNSSSSRGHHSDDSDDGWAAPTKKKKSKTPPVEAPPADLHDIERCRLSRTRFARVAFYPGHDEALTGCYVRIHIGPDPNTKQSVYRMAVINGFKTGRPYAIENDRGKTLVVDQYVIAAHGKAEREWPFIACSESNFTESEWNRYQAVCKNENVQIPKKPELAKRAAAINGLINHNWTTEEVSAKINRQNSLMDRFSGAERGRLEQALQQARAHGNDVLANELQDKLDNTPQPRLAFSTTLKKSTPVKPSAPSQQDRLAEKNAANRQLNAKNVREAQLAERRKVREKEREDAIARGEVVKSKKAGQTGAAEDNSSSRLDSGTNTPSATPKSKPKGAVVPSAIVQLKEAQAKSIVPQIHKMLTDDDIIGALDLDIDVEID